MFILRTPLPVQATIHRLFSNQPFIGLYFRVAPSFSIEIRSQTQGKLRRPIG